MRGENQPIAACPDNRRSRNPQRCRHRCGYWAQPAQLRPADATAKIEITCQDPMRRAELRLGS
jgi:hypothetical protein